MTILGFTLGFLELIFISVFFLLMIIGASLDRRGGQEEAKWVIFVIGLVAVAAWFWKDWTFVGLYEYVTSAAFWTPVGYYLAAGLVYSVVEFVLDVRRSARSYREQWAEFLTRKNHVRTADGAAQAAHANRDIIAMAATNEYARSVAVSEVNNYIHHTNQRNRIVGLDREPDALQPSPVINKMELSQHLGAWTIFWPFYALSLIFGDLLTEVFNAISTFLVTISGRFVRMSFSDVFKI